jgi:hypothetical protein
VKLEDIKCGFAAIVGVGNWPIDAIDLSLKILLTLISIFYVGIRIWKELKNKTEE